MKHYGDMELITLIRESDSPAFDELHRRFWHELFKIAYKKIGDKDETNDLLQEMFIELWEKRHALEFNNSVGSWLRNRLWFKIATYFRLKGFSEKHLENFRSMLIREEQTAVSLDHMELRDADEFYQEILRVINKGIDDMPERMRQIFTLSRSGDYTVREIAEKLNVSPQTVKTQLERARAKLKKAAALHQPNRLEFIFILWLINC